MSGVRFLIFVLSSVTFIQGCSTYVEGHWQVDSSRVPGHVHSMLGPLRVSLLALKVAKLSHKKGLFYRIKGLLE